MALDFYVYGAGTQMQKALNAVATFFTTNTFGSLVEIALQLAFVISVTLFLLYRDTKHVMRFAIIYLAIPTFLITMKTTVQINDAQNPMNTYSVDNVPYIVAIPGWAATTFMHGLTDGIETVFSSTEDKKYSTSGMTFGSSLYTLLRSTNAETVQLQQYWKDFYHNCILGDIRINRKYSMQDIMQEPDLLGFLASQPMSPVRGLYDPDGHYQTCKEALPNIITRFINEANAAFNKLGSYIFGREAGLPSTFIRNAIENSHNDLIGVSNNAVDILKQNMAINMTRWNIENNHHGLASNYAYTSNQMQTTTMWANIGLQAKEFIPMMHSIGVILFVCFGAIVVIIALMPHMSLAVLKNYFGSFFYLGTWPMIFTILNAIMMWFLESATNGATQGLHGITLSNMNGIDYVNTRYASITGYLMMSTPAIALALTKGAAAMMSSLNYQLAGMINQTNARTSTAASTGDISHGNTQLQNHAFNNVHGNKFDTSTLLKQHGTTTQQSDGMMTTQYGDRTVYDTTPTASNFQWNVASSSQYAEAVNEQYTQAQSNLSAQQAALSQSVQSGSQLMADWKDTASSSQSYGLSHGHGASAAATKGLEQVSQATEQVMNATGWSHDKANAFLHSMYGGVDGNLGGKLGGKAGPLDLSVGASLSAGTKWTDEDRETISNFTNEQQSQIQAAIESYRAGANQTIDASNRLTADERNSEVGTYATGFAANFNETQGLMTSATQSQQEVDTLSRANSLEQRQMASLTEKLEIPFQEFVEGRYREGEAKQILTGNSDDARQLRANEWEEFKQTDAFKDFVLASVPTQENHQSQFNGEPTQAEWQAMAGEQYKGKALSNTSNVILDQQEQRGGADDHYNADTHTQIVGDARDQFYQTADYITPPSTLQESGEPQKNDT
ncbi:conjugal transfer protein TraG N-terminal domain-containing protein [Vibrio parahaemolyticus]|uniref:Conjugal transfer protein TraG N-terminal domain-containing protein n=1 Tax=Vibrio parahaemolyticus TaxID=670 RepID=A0A9Q3UIR3_VIBPH|nr:conjugal transfer protein TraG N-terminal domain-containing protein [Vibrio parahaemolyticus]MCC3807505.1 conjugal transfer protein TraG N-terminal domain-containing protein [Vibrio parahaemolyticus]MCI9696472.1 conjugal transfer protein TraG N-terminal domain-containing protein [Vibrio parahaemolyticus]MCI9711064.1 conjugal transfer protein TraG N-terminal domain-containing protein [Vibrio parahaemolyticus]MCI9715944.1 conjugal transfer protein TraG N-terminal domain-containing protein [Vib